MSDFVDMIVTDIIKERTAVEYSQKDYSGDNSAFDSMINKLGHKIGLQISIRYCRSFDKYTVSISDRRSNQHTILYDEYLTEVFHSLNILFAQGCTVTEYNKQFYLLMIEKLFVLKKYTQCLLLMNKYMSIPHDIEHGGNYSEEIITKVKSFTSIQRCFLLYHEVAHCLFQGGFVLDCELENVVFRLDTVANKERAFLTRVPELSEIYSALMSNQRFIEECYCDNFAFNACVSSFVGVLNYTLFDVLQATTLIFHHFKALSYTDFFGEFSLNDKAKFGDILHRTTCMTDLRTAYAMYIFAIEAYDSNNATIGNDAELERIHSCIDSVRKYYEANNFNIHANEIFSVTSSESKYTELPHEDEIAIFIHNFLTENANL